MINLKNYKFVKLPQIGDIWRDGDVGFSSEHFLILGDIKRYDDYSFRATCLLLEYGRVVTSHPIYTTDEFIS